MIREAETLSEHAHVGCQPANPGATTKTQVFASSIPPGTRLELPEASHHPLWNLSIYIYVYIG